MKIVELRISHFARLRAVTIRPDGSLVEITGKNSQGKTSTLAAIWTAFLGRSAAPPVPIHQGAEEARITVDLGELVITRTFKATKGASGDVTTGLKITMADGRVPSKPQAILDALVGDLSFNPLEFSRLKPREQADRLKALVPGFDFTANQLARDRAYQNRTTFNRNAEQQRAAARVISFPPGPEPTAIDVSAKLVELEAAMRHNSAVDETVRTLAEKRRAIDAIYDEIEKLEARIATLEQNATTMLLETDTLQMQVKDKLDPSAIRADIQRAEEVDRVRALFRRRREHEQTAIKAEEDSAQMSAEIAALDRAKADAIAAAKLPVPGLSLTDDAVMLNGVPFASAGTAEKIKTGVAIAMSLNPNLRVILIDEGSELDRSSLEMVAEMAEERGFQVWLTKVDESGEVGIVIEDGAIKGDQ